MLRPALDVVQGPVHQKLNVTKAQVWEGYGLDSSAYQSFYAVGGKGF